MELNDKKDNETPAKRGGVRGNNRRLHLVIEKAEQDIAYYSGSNDPMNIGRVIEAEEILKVATTAPNLLKEEK